MFQSVLVDAARVEQTTPIQQCGSARLLKTLLTNECENSCHYCVNRHGREVRRAGCSVEEMTRLTQRFTREGRVRGLFLSSGVVGGVEESSTRVVRVAERLRREGYPEYIHLRLMPGVSRDTIKRAVGVADRVGVNVEASNTGLFHELCPEKDYKIDVLRRLRWIAGEARERDTSVDTQMIVGALPDDDKSILRRTEDLYDLGLARVYYSGFQPIRETPLSDREYCPGWRVHRLYQASYLLRDYGLNVDDLRVDEYLPDRDPKEALVEELDPPLDPNDAPREELLLVPGVGPRLSRRMIEARPIGGAGDLLRIGVPRKSLEYFRIGTTLDDFF